MQITAFLQVINYLQEKSLDTSIIEGYKKLSEIVKESSGNPGNIISAVVFREKENLRDILLKSNPDDWDYTSSSLFNELNQNKLFGKAGADYLDSLFDEERFDYKDIYSDLIKKIKLLSRMSDTLTRLRQLFDQLLPSEVLAMQDNNDKKLTLFLYFEGRLSVQNITDLERYARLWDGILGTFSRLTGEEQLSLEMTSFRNGNFALGVAAGERTMSALGICFNAILDSLTQKFRIRRTQIEITSLPLTRDFNEILEEEIQILINQIILELAQRLISEHQIADSNREEMTGDLSRSLIQILSFIEKGGKIELKPLTFTEEAGNTNRILNDSFRCALEIEKLTDELAGSLSKKESYRTSGQYLSHV